MRLVTGSSRQAAQARVVHLARSLAATLERDLGATLEEACGLPLAWLDVLRRIRAAEPMPIAIGKLADQLVLTSGGITRLVDRMEQAGLIRRSACPTDRRSWFVGLTPEGRAQLEVAVVWLQDSIAERLDGALTPAGLAELERSLVVLHQAIGGPDVPAS